MTASAFQPGALHVLAETDEIAALSLKGEFDLANAPQITEEGKRLLAEHKHLIVDLSEATFIDSTVLHGLLDLAQEATRSGRATVLQLGTASVVERAVEISGVVEVLPCAGTRPEAVATIEGIRGANP